MSPYFRLSTFGFGLLLTLITSQLTSAATVEERINKLLDEAMTATTMASAEEIITDAENLLNKAYKAKRMDEIERDFIQTHIKQIRGRIYIAWGQRLKNINMFNKGYDWLRLASDDYETLIRKCEGKLEDKADQSRQRRKNLPSDSKRSQIIERNIILAKYKRAWAEYTVADASDERTDRENRFNSALEKFRQFTEEGDPNQPLIADCFIGQAQCLYALERYSEIVELLDPEKFKPENIKSKDKEEIKDIFKRTTLWRMKAYQKVDNHKMAEDSAKQYFDTLSENSKLDDIELEMVIMRVRSLGALINDNKYLQSHQTFRACLNELSSLIEAYGVQWSKRLAEELNIKSPYWYLNEAEKNLKARNFKEALNYAQTGLKGCVEGVPPSNRGQDTRDTPSEEKLCADLRYIKCVAYLRQNNWRQAHLAAKEFMEYHPKDSRAIEVCGWAIKSGLEALKSEPPLETESFLKFLEHAEKNFPKNSEFEKIPWYKAYLRLQDGQYLASQKILETIEPNSPVYRQSQYYLALAIYKQAQALIEAGDSEQKDITKLLGDTVAALDRFAEKSPENLPEAEVQLARNAVTLTIETSRCLLNLNSTDPNTANAVLAFIERMQTLQNIVHQSEDQWLTQHIKANLLAGNINSAVKLIDTLLGEATIANTLIDISKLLEQTSARLSESNKIADAENIDKKLIMVYSTLFDNYISKSTDEQMRANEPSVRVLMANCYSRLREYHKAIDHYEWCMNNAPQGKSPDVIRSLAIAYEQTKSYDKALPQWRKLYSSLGNKRTNDSKMTNEWIEAGYHLILCHNKAGNHDHARKVLEHFELLCPRSELGEWGQKFDALKKELLPTNAGPNP
jgi:hypothetical protein